MDAIDGINPIFGVGNNPFLLEFLAHKPAVTGKDTVEAPHPYQEEPSPLSVEIPLLSQDPQYLASTLGLLLERARYYFLRGNYEAAQQEYKQYLFFEHRYSRGYSGITSEYFQVLFEYGWLSDLNHQRKETERMLNESLLKMLEPVLTPQPNQSQGRQLIRQFVEAFQELEQLPTPMRMRDPVPDEVLMKLVKKLMSQGEPEIARLVLGQLEVRNLLTVFRADYMARRIYEQVHPRGGPSVMLLPLLYTRIGLPYAPYNPLANEENQRVQTKIYEHEELQPEALSGMPPLSRDPNEEEERERRRKRQRYQKQGKGAVPPLNRPSSFKLPPMK